MAVSYCVVVVGVLALCLCGAEAQGIGPLINQTLEKIRPMLHDIPVPYISLPTGDQEFGNLVGILEDATLAGIDEFQVLVLDVPLIPLSIQNLTLYVPNVHITSLYDLDGLLNWPLGGDIHLYGKGDLTADIIDITVSMKVTIKHDNDSPNWDKIVDHLDLYLDIGNFQIHLTNLMGGGTLEETFNSVINEIAMTIVDYYKPSLIEGLKPVITQVINSFLAGI